MEPTLKCLNKKCEYHGSRIHAGNMCGMIDGPCTDQVKPRIRGKKMKAESTKELLKFIYDEADLIVGTVKKLLESDNGASVPVEYCVRTFSAAVADDFKRILKDAKTIQQYAKEGLDKPDLFLCNKKPHKMTKTRARKIMLDDPQADNEGPWHQIAT